MKPLITAIATNAPRQDLNALATSDFSDPELNLLNIALNYLFYMCTVGIRSELKNAENKNAAPLAPIILMDARRLDLQCPLLHFFHFAWSRLGESGGEVLQDGMQIPSAKAKCKSS